MDWLFVKGCHVGVTIYISFKFPSLTLWARCFNRGGNVRHLSYICVIGYKCVCVCARAPE